jgi:hypothetical protein
LLHLLLVACCLLLWVPHQKPKEMPWPATATARAVPRPRHPVDANLFCLWPPRACVLPLPTPCLSS